MKYLIMSLKMYQFKECCGIIDKMMGWYYDLMGTLSSSHEIYLGRDLSTSLKNQPPNQTELSHTLITSSKLPSH